MNTPVPIILAITILTAVLRPNLALSFATYFALSDKLRIMTDNYTLRPLQPHDLSPMIALLPQLADFEIPQRRNPRDLWASDAELIKRVAAKQTPQSFADVVADTNNQALGLILVTLREELLSHAPSAHLEAIVVAPHARGLGLGKMLLDHAEHRAQNLGAQSLTLHVFANNTRARALYDANNYDSELIRAIKWLT